LVTPARYLGIGGEELLQSGLGVESAHCSREAGHSTHLSAGIVVPTLNTFFGEKSRGESVVIEVDGLMVLSASSDLNKSH